MLTTKQATVTLKFVIPIFIAIVSICVLSFHVPKTKYISQTQESLDHSRETMMKFSGAAVATSAALSALPGDFGTPIANELASLTKYFVFLFAVIFVEKLITTQGIHIAFVYIIPIACGLFMLAVAMKKEAVKKFSYKIAILGCALIIIVPVSTHFTDYICAEYLEYVENTIEETKSGADKINGVVSENDKKTNLFDKLSDVCNTAMNGVNELIEYFNNMLKKCINSIAIMFVTSFVMPIVILLIFRWLLKELFRENLEVLPYMTKVKNKIGNDNNTEAKG